MARRRPQASELMADELVVLPAPGPSRSRRRWLQLGLLGVGLLGLALVVRQTIADAEDVSMPGAPELVVAFLLTWASLGCGARAWITLIGPPADPRLLAAALYQSQLVKYIPGGGVAQAAGQVTMTAMHDLPVRRVTLAYLVLGGTTVLACTTIGVGLAGVSSLPTWARALALLGLLSPLLLRRPFLANGLRVVRRRFARLPDPDDLPSQPALWRAWGWSLANQLLYAMGFVVLLRAVTPDITLLPALVGYVAAWLVGFLALPIPSGVGVREAVLVALIPGVTVAPLLAASLAQRLVAIAAEVARALGNKLHRHLR
jgi:uncharacterized membrane protein YbhN (UPF0104 family)